MGCFRGRKIRRQNASIPFLYYSKIPKPDLKPLAREWSPSPKFLGDFGYKTAGAPEESLPDPLSKLQWLK
jgi:hypothetical protein